MTKIVKIVIDIIVQQNSIEMQKKYVKLLLKMD